jgi:hypothetical protein
MPFVIASNINVIASVAGTPLLAYARVGTKLAVPRVVIRTLSSGTARGRGARH